MRRLCPILAVAALLSLMCLAVPTGAADLPLKPYSYHETFEGPAPAVALWASRGAEPTVNFMGVTPEQAAEGKQSFKLDLTFGDSPYYYYGLPVRVPMAGKLTISARLRLGPENKARVGFGVNANYPPTRHSGCGTIKGISSATEWTTVEGDLVAIGQEGAAGVVPRYVYGVTGAQTAPLLDRWGIFLNGQPGQRATAGVRRARAHGARVPIQPPARLRGLWRSADDRRADRSVVRAVRCCDDAGPCSPAAAGRVADPAW